MIQLAVSWQLLHVQEEGLEWHASLQNRPKRLSR